ncbi:raffinose/stachyose/melibiose transport system permease protein [Paenibacillus anaericanus]|uniref:carbohydrate ABC transporter permease n=1 Tax=Paenibacillus anaericanus TaxID=170367 RepID=UPI00278B4AB6|nr:sugar ABC transporter permease [Paenibacillus anaericanus]MDQ0087410.1 raffinose/stachyose/melibiose transport system permease protein [Paenibacillus anaericanus]
MTNKARGRWIYAGFVAPAIIFFALIILIPFLKAIIFSFQDWDGISSNIAWIGWGNYERLLHDESFWNSFKFTVKYVLATTVFLNVFGLVLALGLNRAIKGRNLLRTIFFLPYVMGSVIVGFIWQFIITNLFNEIGVSTGWTLFQKNWLSLPDYAFWSIVMVAVWQSVGYFMIIYLSALQGVSKDLVEASEIDGAGYWSRMRNVVFPLIRPAITINLFLAIANGFKGFDLNYSLTGGGPFGTTQSLAYHIYTEGFGRNLFTYASAKAVIFFLILATVTIVQSAVLKRREVEL